MWPRPQHAFHAVVLSIVARVGTIAVSPTDHWRLGTSSCTWGSKPAPEEWIVSVHHPVERPESTGGRQLCNWLSTGGADAEQHSTCACTIESAHARAQAVG